MFSRESPIGSYDEQVVGCDVSGALGSMRHGLAKERVYQQGSDDGAFQAVANR